MSGNALDRPVVLFDGNCGFCKRKISRWRALGGDRLEWTRFQDAGERFPNLSQDDLGRAMHLVEPDGHVRIGAEGVFRIMQIGGRPVKLWAYENLPGFAAISEMGYRFISGHRNLVDPIDRWLFGRSPEPLSHRLTISIFLRGLGLIYLIAFISLWMQISGLVGSHGILPIGNYLEAVRGQFSSPTRYFEFPTLCWLSSSDGFLQFLCGGGAVMSLMLIAGVAPIFVLVGLWVFYLSLLTAGQDFLSFQWDILLLEAGFAAIWLAPMQLFMRWRRAREPSHIALWIARWLAFRIMFLSGIVKLIYGDMSWRNGTALNYHYWTQPLPPWSAWYMNRLPQGFMRFSCSTMFFAELIVPFLIFTPRLPRRLAFFGIAVFQVTLLLTGNYGFFNTLTIVVCLPLLEDSIWPKFLRRNPGAYLPRSWWRTIFVAPVAVVLLIVTCFEFTVECKWDVHWPSALMELDRVASPFHVANGYGLFRVMTKHRYEVIVEGSDDGVDWKPYEFKYKPGDIDRRPAVIPGHMPRLDWQMWFIPDYAPPGWFMNFLVRLLQGSPPVIGLLKDDPFPNHPPKYVRAELYDYHFSDDPKGKAWWQRVHVGEYVPIISLRGQ